MGNDQSGGGRAKSQGSKTLNSPTMSVGVPASFSFLARKRNSTKSLLANSIVVVNDGASTSSFFADSSAAQDLRRIKEIPTFMPLLRGVLPGCRDLPDVLLKVDPRPFYKFLSRLQQHFKICAETVTAEQGRIFAQIVEIDQLTSSLVKKTTNSTKKLDLLENEFQKVKIIAEQLDTAQVFFHELTRCAESLNQLLPPDEQMAPLSLVFTPIFEEKKKLVGLSRVKLEEDEALGWTKDEDGRSFLAGRVSECRVVDSDYS